MNPISAAAYIEKNKLTSTGVWLVLLAIDFLSGVQRVCINTENITWDGETWYAFPIELDDIGDSSKGEVPQLTAKVSNVTQVFTGFVEAEVGAIGRDITIYVVHSDHLDLSSPEVEYVFEIMDCEVTDQWISWAIGASNPHRKRFPANRIWKEVCRYKVFADDVYCKYASKIDISGTSTGDTSTSMTDTTVNFVSLGVTAGLERLFNADGRWVEIDSITTTTNPNDTLVYTEKSGFTLSSGEVYQLLTECDRSLTRCKVLENHIRFGGAPTVGSNAIYY